MVRVGDFFRFGVFTLTRNFPLDALIAGSRSSFAGPMIAIPVMELPLRTRDGRNFRVILAKYSEIKSVNTLAL